MNYYILGLLIIIIILIVCLYISSMRARINAKEMFSREVALQESDRKFHALVEGLSEGLTLSDELGVVVEWNNALELITGIKKLDALGKYVWDIQESLMLPDRRTPDTLERVKKTLQDTLRTGTSPIINKNIEIELYQPSGKRITIEQLNFTVKSEKGYWLGSILRDISTRKQAENIFNESLLRLNALLNNIPDIAWIKDSESQFVAANKPLADLYQTTPDAMIGKTDFDLCAAELARSYQVDDQDVMLSKQQKRIEECLVAKDGKKYWLETIKTPIFNTQGEVVGTAGLGRDITERKRVERVQDVLYRISEAAHTAQNVDELYRIIHTSIQGLMPAKNLYIAYYEKSTDLLYFPYHADERDLEWPPLKPGKGLTRYVYTTGKPLLATPEVFQRLLDSGEIELIGQKPIDWLGVPLRTQHGIIGVMAVQTYHLSERLSEEDKDILVFVSTQVAMAIERRQVEAALRTSQANLAEAQHLAHIGSWDWNLLTNEVSWSEEIFRIAGWDTGVTPSFDAFFQLVHPEDRTRVQEAIEKTIRQFQPYRIDHRLIRADGTELVLQRQAEVIFDDNKQPVRMIGTVQDITEIRRAEAERDNLIKELQAKNTELDRFTYTVSHDLRAPLVTIRGFLGFVEKDIRSGNTNQLTTDLARITAAVNKMQRFLDELLELSRAGRMVNPPEPVSFQTIVSDAVELIRGRIDARGVKVIIAEDLPVILCDRMRFTQVVQNLVDNAVKFLGNQPKPFIEIGMQGLETEGKAIFFVRDNGIGIEPQYQAKIFGLFNKLDNQTEGTGIGLTLVKRIVEAHNGKVWLKSDPGTGSTFYFTCPLYRDAGKYPYDNE
jgi:PAS domain S-box-containing protein